MLIAKSELCRLIPHSGGMCLLDGVLDWNEDFIVCVSMSHRDPNNPLRRNGRLAALHSFEYGAQSIAVHGGLLARTLGRQAPPAYLAALRDARLNIEYLDEIQERLEINAQKLMAANGNMIYQVEILAAETALAQAKITIIAQAAGE